MSVRVRGREGGSGSVCGRRARNNLRGVRGVSREDTKKGAILRFDLCFIIMWVVMVMVMVVVMVTAMVWVSETDGNGSDSGCDGDSGGDGASDDDGGDGAGSTDGGDAKVCA